MNKKKKTLKTIVETRRYVECPNCGYHRFPVDGLLGYGEPSFLGYDRLYCSACSHAFGLVAQNGKVVAVNVRPHYKPATWELQ